MSYFPPCSILKSLSICPTLFTFTVISLSPTIAVIEMCKSKLFPFEKAKNLSFLVCLTFFILFMTISFKLLPTTS